MFSPIRFTAETIEVDSDENGFELVVTDTDGMVHRINVQECLPDVSKAGRAIDDYFAAGKSEAEAHDPGEEPC